jgi:hypothetical protein
VAARRKIVVVASGYVCLGCYPQIQHANTLQEARNTLPTDLPFLDSYAGQSTNELIDLEGSYRVDSIVLAFEEALQRKEILTQQEKVVLSVEALEREANKLFEFIKRNRSSITIGGH